MVFSEFDKYHVFLGPAKSKQQITKLREEPTFVEFRDNLEPGKTYTVTVKTVSGKVSSWPTAADVTLSKSNQVKVTQFDLKTCRTSPRL